MLTASPDMVLVVTKPVLGRSDLIFFGHDRALTCFWTILVLFEKKKVQKVQKKEIWKKTEFCSKTRAPAAQTFLLSARVKYTVVNISLNGWPPPTIFSKTFCWRRSAMAGGWFTPKKFVCFFFVEIFLHIFSFNIFSSRKKLAVKSDFLKLSPPPSSARICFARLSYVYMWRAAQNW